MLNVGLMKIPIDKKLEVDMETGLLMGDQWGYREIFQYYGPRLIV